MLPKKNRFTFKEKLPKQILNSQSFTLRYQRNEEGLRAGVVVSKKVDKRATVRNKIKRAILEAVGKTLGKEQSLTLVFYAKGAAASSDLAKEVENKLMEISSS